MSLLHLIRIKLTKSFNRKNKNIFFIFKWKHIYSKYLYNRVKTVVSHLWKLFYRDLGAAQDVLKSPKLLIWPSSSATHKITHKITQKYVKIFVLFETIACRQNMWMVNGLKLHSTIFLLDRQRTVSTFCASIKLPEMNFWTLFC